MNGRNPFLPPELHIPDGEAHVMSDGRVYLYGSLDKDTDSFCSQEYVVASSADMQSWTIHPGPSFTSAQAAWGNPGGSKHHSSLSEVKCFDDLPAHIRKMLPDAAKLIPIKLIVSAIEKQSQKGLPKDLRLYAPDAIEKDGKYYLYFCMSDDSEGVAVSDRPEGPFGNPVKLPVQGIDPAVFIDTDGQAYYYWGQFSANAAKLNPDMMSIDESSIVHGILTEQEHHFHEGSSVRKRGDTYYYVFADVSRGKPTCLGYATGKSPLGPFTYQGIIIDNASCDPGSWNNHGSIEEVNGQWYVFYHRSNGNSQRMRRACAEPIFFDENGLIREVKMTSQGAGKPFAPGEYIPAHTACEVMGGAYVEGDALVLPAGGSAIFRYFENQMPICKVMLEGNVGNTLQICVDDSIVCDVTASEAAVSIPAGQHELCIRNTSGATVRLTGLAFYEP